VCYMGGGVACAHHAQPGETAVDFARPVDLIDPLSGRVVQEGARRWLPSGELLTTSVIYYR